MLKDITTIELQGANFITPQKLALLSQNGTPTKATLIYGRNGSGKSTIAKAFKKIKGADSPSVQAASLYDIHNSVVTLTRDEQQHIFVFDEDYVFDNVRVQEEGLDSIVMLGEQVGLAGLIATATAELHEAETDRDQKKAAADVYNNMASDKSPKYYIEKMKSALRGDRSWAERDKKIKGNATNSPVSDVTYKEFIRLSPTKTRDELAVDYNAEWEKLKAAQSGAAKITVLIPSVPDSLTQFDAVKGNELLQQVIEHPELSEREQYLLGLVQNAKGEELRQTAKEFADPAINRCPKCHQSLSTHYKMDLIASIHKVLSEEVKNHQRQLESIILPVLEIDISCFSGLEHYQSCIDSIEALNGLIQKNNSLINSKMENPYTPITEELESITDTITALITALQNLDNDREAFNRTITDTRPIKAKLSRINNDMAYYDVIGFSQKHDEMKAEKETADNVYADSLRTVDEKKRALDELNAKRDSINIAIDVINDGLKYIFFSDSRMKIQVENGSYMLICNGRSVRPKDISVGERNIIGLCYFFTEILQRKNRDAAYSEEYLLIIDDPVSSYDFENKVGILSFLKHQLGMFLLGNIETRVLVLTHDLLTAIDLEKMLDELMKACNSKYNGQRRFGFAPYELNDKEIGRFIKNRNEYTELIKLVYEYANGGAIKQSAYIGNIMRQVMEAFATFEFKKSIHEVSTDDLILSVMEREEDRNHYRNLMYRIVLNEGSHRYDQTRNMQMDFLSMISEPDRRRTAKEILCFMYLLNQPHVRAHLGEVNCGTIESWCEEIRT